MSAALSLWLAASPSANPRAQGYSPGEAVSRMTVRTGFEVSLYASEPMIAQPVCIEFDDRGRLWVIQYLQYPNPAGLQRAKVDRWSRTVYDRTPEPPPRGPKGADRITILEDTDHDGRADQARDFVNGLNLASGLALGHGGVFVLNPPYLLFYPDRDHDDVPDADPEVLVSGFGMEDAHSVANSLTWGPDGWLYGCQGSTVTAHIRGLEFQQGVWRFHPVTRRFELFCEGGGNSWGLDFDEDGNLFYSTNMGGYRLFHGVQGGYYWKSFGKHGALHNPYTFGYFDHAPHQNFRGGHVTTGGIVYQGDSFPEFFRGKYISGDLLGHAVQWHHIKPWGSSVETIEGGELLVPHDLWSAPCDVTLAPDGSVFVADWFDQRTAHPDPDAQWDRSNGRVYRIAAQGSRPVTPPRWQTMTSASLIALLESRNDWLVRRARRILAERRDGAAVAPLRSLVLNAKEPHLALEALWALQAAGGFDEALGRQVLAHRAPQVRRWAVQLLGDGGGLSAGTTAALLGLAATEPDVRVRSQLASIAQRLPAEAGLALAHRLAVRNLDAADPHIPLLLWWAVERHALEALDKALALFANPGAWDQPLVRSTILERLMRRYAAEGTSRAGAACARLLEAAPGEKERGLMLAALEQGLRDRPSGNTGPGPGGLFEGAASVERKATATRARPEPIPGVLEQQLAALWTASTTNRTLITLEARLGLPRGLERASTLAADGSTPADVRAAMLRLLGELERPEAVPVALRVLEADEPEPLRLAALDALRGSPQDDLAAALLRRWAGWNQRVRGKARELLLGRKAWARAFLEEVDQGRIAAAVVPVEQLRMVALHQDSRLDQLVTKHWGTVTSGTPEEKLAEMRRFNNDLNAGPGDPSRGRELFKNICAVCHRLYDEGEAVGPDLTHANRKDREFLLASLVDPSAVIRKEYLNYNVETADGAVQTGLIAEQSPSSVTLMAARNERVTINRNSIRSIRESAVSLMPEGLLTPLKPQELRDLFGYLQSDGPRPTPGALDGGAGVERGRRK